MVDTMSAAFFFLVILFDLDATDRAYTIAYGLIS